MGWPTTAPPGVSGGGVNSVVDVLEGDTTRVTGIAGGDRLTVRGRHSIIM